MAFDFPATPVLNDEYASGGMTYVYNGQGWTIKASGGAVTDLWVDVTGDTMTGPLVISGVNASSQSLTTTGTIVSDSSIISTSDGLYALGPGGANLGFGDNASGAQTAWINFWASATGYLEWSIDGTIDTMHLSRTGQLFILGGIHTKPGSGAAAQPNVHNMEWLNGVMALWVDAISLGNITVVPSDYRIKKDVTDLSTMWNTVKNLRPISYTQAEFSPPAHTERAAENGIPLFVADDIERWGFIAHELQDTLIPSAATAEKDAPNAIQSPNPMTVIAALTKALQEAMARIEALEATR